ncbi:hypothetical protein FOZ62_004143, partial [Perkinsus olseni]
MPPQSPRRSRRLQGATGPAARPDDDEEQQQQREGHPESSATAATKEVSMTVEESNKLREKLGLRKLTTNDNNDAPEGSAEKPKLLVDEHDDDAEGYDAKAAIRKRRDKRIHEQLVSGTTLGEASSTVESAADWVERSNNNNNNIIIQSFTWGAEHVLSSLLNEGASAAAAPPPPSKKHRKGSSPSRAEEEGVADVRLKVAHNVEDLREGETILTMKDKPILACGTEEEEDSDDEIVLEEAGGPQGLAQKEKEDIWRKEKRRSAWDPTLHWDDNEDEEGGGGDGILDKYTTVEERAAADARRRGFTLAVSSSTQNGEQTLRPELTQDVEARLKELTEDNKRRSMMQSVSGGSIHIQSDVMDTNEAAKFIKRRNKEARRAMRRRTSKVLEEDNKTEGDIVIPSPKRTMGSPGDDDDDLQDAEEDQELYRQLERQKMVEQKVKARSLVKEELVEGSEGPAASAAASGDAGGDAGGVIDLDTGASYVQSHLGAEVKDEKMEGPADDDDDDQVQQPGGKNDDNGGGGGRMSRASEFCASIRTPVELKQGQKDEEFAAQRAYCESRRRMLKGAARRGVATGENTGGKQSETASSTTSERQQHDDDHMELSSNATGEDGVGSAEEEEARDHDFEARDEAMQDQKVDDGAACAIRYFVERGMMSGDQDSFNSYDPGKRPMTSEEAELRIDHRDEFGRVQSAKEAFRTMSWRFHGKGPHWKNVERRVNRIQNDMKRRQETSQVAPTLRALERVQKKEGNSYMLLTGGTAAPGGGSGPATRGASPTLLFTCGGVCGTLALLLIVFGILVRTLFYPTLIDGIDKMRYIDNTKEVEGECSNLLLGDLTCPGLAYEAWLMSSTAARQVCLSDTRPDAKATEIWTGWCDEEGEGRCVKPDMCRYGLPYTFYPYTVTNPKEILLEGKKPIVEELEPILLASTHENIQDLTDVELWDTEGIARWEEVNTFVPSNGDDTYVDERMSQRIIVPNIALLGTMFFEGQEATPLGTLEMLGVLGVIQSVARTLTASIDTAPATLKTPVLGQFTTSENAAKMQYFHSSLSLLLGPSAGLSGELSLKALGPVFTSSLPNGDVLAASLPPTEMGSEFFAYTFGCVALHHRQTASCICDENIEEHRSRKDAIEATFSPDSQERVWRFIYDTDFNQQTQATISLFILQSQLTASEYAAFITHIVYAGSYALSNYDPLRHAIWPVTDPNSPDYDSDYDYYPRFINMTIAQLLGYKG